MLRHWEDRLTSVTRSFFNSLDHMKIGKNYGTEIRHTNNALLDDTGRGGK